MKELQENRKDQFEDDKQEFLEVIQTNMKMLDQML